MINKKVAIILGNYKDYIEKYGPDCIDGLRDQDYEGEMKIFVYDNETSPESFESLARIIPRAELVLNMNNDGFAKGNNDCIKLALSQGFDYVFCLNMDVVVEKSCVRKLIEVFENSRSRIGVRDDSGEIGAVQARLMLHPETDRLNSLGNVTHFLGFGYSVGYREEYEKEKRDSIDRCHSLLAWTRRDWQNDRYVERDPSTPLHSAQDDNLTNKIATPLARNDSVMDIAYPSGAAVMFSKDVLEKVGLFDEEFWMYNEDQDLGWRIWLAGYRCVLAPDAVVYHKYEFSKSISKYYWMDRNRIIVMLKNYHLLTLLLILPAFLVMEFGLILFCLKGGWFDKKLKVWKYFIVPNNWIYLLKARRESQKIRKVKDTEVIELFTGKIWYQEIDDWKLRIMNPVFNLYFKIVKFIIIW